LQAINLKNFIPQPLINREMPSYYKIELGPEHLNPHLKLYLKDISKNSEVKELLEDLPAVDHVNITGKANGKSDLTVYPNRAYEITEVRDDVVAFLDKYFEPATGAGFSLASSMSSTPSASPVPGPNLSAAPPPAEHLTVFISYSWDGKPHQDWVLALADRLQIEGGVRVLLDQYEIRAGKNITHFMEKSVAAADKVVMIMTPNYKAKADGREGGVGFEYSMITAALYAAQGSGKFIPVARIGKYYECSPTFIKSLVSLDMTDDKKFEETFIELLRLIHDEPLVVAPPIGPKPIFPTRKPATAPAGTPAPVPSVAPAATGATPLVDDATNMARSRMPAFAHWTFNFRLNSLADQSLANLYRQIYNCRIPQEGGKYYLPFVLNDHYKKSHHPDVDYAVPLKNDGVANMFNAAALKITKGNICYEYSEYSDHPEMLLRIMDPFTTLFYLLVILKSVHEAMHKQVAIEIEVQFKSNRKAVFYVPHSPIPVSRKYGLQTMMIPGNESSRKTLLSDINHDSLLDVFNELYGMFMAENQGSNMPFIELERATFIEVIKEFIAK